MLSFGFSDAVKDDLSSASWATADMVQSSFNAP